MGNDNNNSNRNERFSLMHSVRKTISRFSIRFIRKLQAPSLYKLAKSRSLNFPEPISSDRFADPSCETANQLFKSLAEQRRELAPTLIDNAQWFEHVKIEVEKLREEILEIKRREIASERFIAGGIATIYLAYSKNLLTDHLVLLIPIFFTIFGFIRFREYQRNVFEIDCYLKEIEELIRPDGGWVTYFFKGRAMNRYFESRFWFWVVLLMFSFGLFLAAQFCGYEGTDLSIQLIGNSF